jgi:hypothetical protein
MCSIRVTCALFYVYNTIIFVDKINFLKKFRIFMSTDISSETSEAHVETILILNKCKYRCPTLNDNTVELYTVSIIKCIRETDIFSNTGPHNVLKVLSGSQYGRH